MASEVSVDDIISKDIFELMGAKDMPEERKRNLYTKILATIQNRVIARIADSLNDKDTEEWTKVKETGDRQKMNEFMTSKGIDINKLLMQEALIYKLELVKLAEPIRKASEKTKE